jgi:hypothetical protein
MVQEGEQYMATLAALYQSTHAGLLDIDLMKADRMEYLSKLGMAYYDADIAADFVEIVEAG